MNSNFCSEEQFLTIKKINRDQSRIIDSKQEIIEDQARLINTQQQLIDMMYENIRTLKDEINKLQSEIGEDGNSSQYQHQNHYHSRHNINHGSEHSTENVSLDDFGHEQKYGNNGSGNSGYSGYRVLLKNVKNSISLKLLRNQLERAYGPILYELDYQQKRNCAYAYFKNRQHFLKAIDDGRITVDNVTINISSGK